MFSRFSLVQKYYKLIAIDLWKQQKLDTDPKTIRQINFTGNQTREKSAKMYFIIEKAEKTVFDFSKGTVDFIVLI